MRAAFAVITALVATSAGGTFTDPPGDAPGAPDVTRVTVSTRSGPAVFVIQAAGSWDDAASILAVDTNGDGTADVDYTVHSLHDMLTRDTASGAIPTGATFSFSGSTLTYEIPLAELGAKAVVGFAVSTPGPSGEDRAPDRGLYRVRLRDSHVHFTPARPVHGRRFQLVGATKCAARIVGARLAGRCSWVIPANARGKTLVVTAVVDGAPQTFRFRVG